jgi:hypothetical protein
MSERDRDGQISGEQAALMLLVAVFMLVITIVVVDKKNVSELRDLQRRVGQLESERR